MSLNPASLSDEEKQVLSILEMTPEKLAKRQQALDRVKDGLSEWMTKPLSDYRYQTPDEQIANDNYEQIVKIEGAQ